MGNTGTGTSKQINDSIVIRLRHELAGHNGEAEAEVIGPKVSQSISMSFMQSINPELRTMALIYNQYSSLNAMSDESRRDFESKCMQRNQPESRRRKRSCP